MKYGAFVSYSHKDTMYVTPIVSLIQTMRKDLVFQDIKSIQPGEQWKEQITGAIRQADIMVICWCCHAAASKEVKEEYKLALRLKKKILPLLLDDTKITRQLSAYQWIDFSSIIAHGKGEPETADAVAEEEDLTRAGYSRVPVNEHTMQGLMALSDRLNVLLPVASGR